jgi:hypothetical protein
MQPFFPIVASFAPSFLALTKYSFGLFANQ